MVWCPSDHAPFLWLYCYTLIKTSVNKESYLTIVFPQPRSHQQGSSLNNLQIAASIAIIADSVLTGLALKGAGLEYFSTLCPLVDRVTRSQPGNRRRKENICPLPLLTLFLKDFSRYHPSLLSMERAPSSINPHKVTPRSGFDALYRGLPFLVITIGSL